MWEKNHWDYQEAIESLVLSRLASQEIGKEPAREACADYRFGVGIGRLERQVKVNSIDTSATNIRKFELL